MPKVVTFSVFFPPWSNSSAVWAQTKAHQEHSNAASIFFMIAPFERVIVCSRANARNAGRCSRPLPGPSRLLREERSAQRGEFFRRVAAVLSSVDQPKGRLHLAEPLPERLRFSLRFLPVAAARARPLEERPEILSRAHAVARLQRGRRDRGPVEDALLQEPARIFQRGFRGPAIFALRGIRLSATGQGRQQASGAEHDDPGHALAVLEGEANGNAPGLGMAYETRLLQPQGIH